MLFVQISQSEWLKFVGRKLSEVGSFLAKCSFFIENQLKLTESATNKTL